MVASARKERRIGLDRRQFSYDLHIPERRRVRDRRRATRPEDEIHLPDLSKELVARLISDPCLFHEEDDTVAISFGDRNE
ncbi:MAG: hypothetical protein PVG78_12720 [Desulfobacterales bacterium]|jgi:hypothetical protein